VRGEHAVGLQLPHHLHDLADELRIERAGDLAGHY
jgi:hypothetical protein